MKQANSLLISIFIAEVKGGYITAQEEASSWALQKMVEALQAIQKGEKPDKALEITRTKGGPPDPVNYSLASLMHEQFKDGGTWTIAENVANKWLIDNNVGKKHLSLSTLKGIYKQHKFGFLMKEKFKGDEGLVRLAKIAIAIDKLKWS